MRVLREDFKQGTTTDSPLGAAATTINSDEFVDLRAVTGGSLDVVKLILDPSGINGEPEIIYVTAHTASASAVTVSRGRENTTAREHPSGTTWKHGPTAQDFGLQVGEMKQYLGSVAPERWVFARGQALSRSTYAKLFDIIGETFGAGDGTTTFNVPDLQGKFPVGASASAGDYDLGDTGGSEQVTLTAAQMPSHNHGSSTGSVGNHNHGTPTGVAGSHSHGGNTSTTGSGHTHSGGSLVADTGGAHTHSTSSAGTGNVNHGHSTSSSNKISTNPVEGSLSGSVQIGSSTSAHSHTVSGTIGSSGSGHTHSMSADGNHTHSISSDGSHSHTISSAGSGTAHENRPPFVAVNYIIYAGA